MDRATGLLKRLASSAIDQAAPLMVSGRIGAPHKVASAEIIGAVSVAGFRSGAQLWRTSFQQLGFYPTDGVDATNANEAARAIKEQSERIVQMVLDSIARQKQLSF